MSHFVPNEFSNYRILTPRLVNFVPSVVKNPRPANYPFLTPWFGSPDSQ